MAEDEIIRPQPGPQTKFISTSADIAIYGGAAGGGKTFSLLLDPLGDIYVPGFNAVIFRRETPQITNPGGLWDEAAKIYPFVGGTPKRHSLSHNFGAAKIKFSHLQFEETVHDWQGAQIPFIGYDELTHFTKKQFFYMMSRNRSTCGVWPRIRATTNPDPDSWVREFLDWWIGKDGFPIPERDGVIRWFRRVNDELIWSDEKNHPDCKSVTFISAKLEDNKILMEKDPSYGANLNAMSFVDRMRLREGNWDIRDSAGNYFRRSWFEIVDAVPADCIAGVRYWDRAASEEEGADWTVGVKMLKSRSGVFYITHVERFKGRPLKVESRVKTLAIQDGKRIAVGIEQDPGQAGVAEAETYVRLLAGWIVKLYKVVTSKITRAKPFSAQCEAGNVKLLRGDWNKTFIDELEKFPTASVKDDQVDASSGAFNHLSSELNGEFTEEMADSGDKTVAPPLEGSELW